MTHLSPAEQAARAKLLAAVGGEDGLGLMEMAAWPGLGQTERAIYLTLIIRPNLDQDRPTLARIVGREASTVAGAVRQLAKLGLYDLDAPAGRRLQHPRVIRDVTADDAEDAEDDAEDDGGQS